MKIAFVDLIEWDYNVETPYQRPLGGSQSALCYLSAQLAADGHEVALVNGVSKPGTFRGVACVGTTVGQDPEFLNAYDFIIVLNSACGGVMRDAGIKAPMVLWSQHAEDQPGVEELKQQAERDAWDAFALISDWQRDQYIASFGIDRERIGVLRNAISPAVEEATPAEPWFTNARPPVLAYTSTPFRGLDVLLLAFPTIRAAIPGAVLKVISDMGIYQLSSDEDDFQVLYQLARSLDGVEHTGAMPQTELAQTLRDVDILAYPNTFAETSCISVMEAMASGCVVLTSRLGALPETTADFGFLMDPPDAPTQFATGFASMAIEIIGKAQTEPETFRARLDRQIAYSKENNCWKARAKEWAGWLASIAATSGR